MAKPLGAALKEPTEPAPGRGAQNSSTGANREFAAAMARLEKAVGEVVKVTTDQLSERATTLLDDTSRRLEAELRLKRVSESNPQIEQDRERRSRRRSARHRMVDPNEAVNPRSGRLYRDPVNQKVGGVCAGIARYFGLEAWTVRLAALTGLIFLPGVVFPAYWIAYFIMDTPKSNNACRISKEAEAQSKPSRRTSRRERSASDTGANEPYLPGRNLRYTSADLTQAELRLRRLESFVTSNQYELHKELTKIEREGDKPHVP